MSWWVTRRVAKQKQSHGLLLVSRGFLVPFVANAAWAVAINTIFSEPDLFLDLSAGGLSQTFISLVFVLISWAGSVIALASYFTMFCFIVYGISIMVPTDRLAPGDTPGSLLVSTLARTGRGTLSGIIAGIIWGGVTILTQFVFFSIFHDAILANVQSSIPGPQPLLPGFPQFGFTQPPDPAQLITAYAHAISTITLILGLLAGGVLGLAMAVFKTPLRISRVALKSTLLGLAAWAIYTIPSLFQSNPLGDGARLFALCAGLVSALVSSSFLGVLYWRVSPRTIIDSQFAKIVEGSQS